MGTQKYFIKRHIQSYNKNKSFENELVVAFNKINYNLVEEQNIDKLFDGILATISKKPKRLNVKRYVNTKNNMIIEIDVCEIIIFRLYPVVGEIVEL